MIPPQAGVARAPERLERGVADVLVPAKLDRVRRSMIDVQRLLSASRAERWQRLALGLAFDTTGATGEYNAGL